MEKGLNKTNSKKLYVSTKERNQMAKLGLYTYREKGQPVKVFINCDNKDYTQGMANWFKVNIKFNETEFLGQPFIELTAEDQRDMAKLIQAIMLFKQD